MAVSTSSYFSNGVPGENQTFPGNVYRADTTPTLPIGFKVSLADGREFRYAHFGAATNRGLIVSTDISESSTGIVSNAIIAPASAVSVVGETAKPGTIGSRFIELTLAATTASQYAGAQLTINGGTGVGYSYRVKGNTATGDPATGNIRLELYDKLQLAVDATTDIILSGSLYANLEGATTTDMLFSGVSMATTTIGQYGFVQTKGIASVLTDGAVVYGHAVGVGSVAGTVAACAAFTTKQIGQVVTVGGDTLQSAIKLAL
jgi:hypothetical protein